MLILEFPCLALEDIPPAPGSALAVSHGECLLPCKPTKSDPFFKGTVSRDYRPFWSNNYMGPYELFRRIFCYFPKIFAKNACPRSQWLDLTTSCTFNGDIFQNEYTRISTPKNEIVPVPEQSHVLWILISIFTLSLIWSNTKASSPLNFTFLKLWSRTKLPSCIMFCSWATTNKAAKQVAEIAEANVAAATTATVKAVGQGAAAAPKAKKAA